MASSPRVEHASDAGLTPGEHRFLDGELGDRIDVVTHMHGLATFDVESSAARTVALDDVLTLPVLPLERIVASKRATGRPKDLAQLPALETALAVLTDR